MDQQPQKLEVRPRLPEWLKVKMPGSQRYLELQKIMRGQRLHTVCAEAHWPNIGECWDRGTATFMILGDICTRSCRYCAVTTGRPRGLDLEEPKRLAETVKSMGLRYCVITSVNRDDLPDGGAYIFASCITKIKESSPDCRVEPQHRINRTHLPQGPPQGRLSTISRTIVQMQKYEPKHCDQVWNYCWDGGEGGRSLGNDVRPQEGRLRSPHHRTILATIGSSYRDGQILPARRI